MADTLYLFNLEARWVRLFLFYYQISQCGISIEKYLEFCREASGFDSDHKVSFESPSSCGYLLAVQRFQ